MDSRKFFPLSEGWEIVFILYFLNFQTKCFLKSGLKFRVEFHIQLLQLSSVHISADIFTFHTATIYLLFFYLSKNVKGTEGEWIRIEKVGSKYVSEGKETHTYKREESWAMSRKTVKFSRLKFKKKLC